MLDMTSVIITLSRAADPLREIYRESLKWQKLLLEHDMESICFYPVTSSPGHENLVFEIASLNSVSAWETNALYFICLGLSKNWCS